MTSPLSGAPGFIPSSAEKAAELTERQLENAQDRQAVAMDNKADAAQAKANLGLFAKVKANRKDKAGRKETIEKARRTTEKGQGLSEEKLKEKAAEYKTKHDEIKPKLLIALRRNISEGDDSEKILKKVAKFNQESPIEGMATDEELVLQYRALEFLEETTSGELQEQVQQAKKELYEKHSQEIQAGINVTRRAEQFAKKGLGTPKQLRDDYRKLTTENLQTPDLLKDLMTRYPEFKDQQLAIKFMYHALGSDLNAAGPSIEPGKLSTLMKEVRKLQAINGVYHFFNQRMGLVNRMATDHGAEMNVVVPRRGGRVR